MGSGDQLALPSLALGTPRLACLKSSQPPPHPSLWENDLERLSVSISTLMPL